MLKKKIAWTGFVVFVLTMGFAMYYTSEFKGYQYSQAEMMYGIWPFILLLLIVSSYLALRYFKETELWFSELEKKQLWWMLPHFLVLIALIGMILTHTDQLTFDTSTKNLIFTTLFTTLMVGIAEELMFRGIIFHTLLSHQRPLKAVLISALAFALLHTVNMLAGLSIIQMLVQFFATFFFGLFFSLMMLRMKNIMVLMLFHWLWDFSVFSLYIVDYQSSLIILIPFLSVLMSVLLLKPKRNKMSAKIM